MYHDYANADFNLCLEPTLITGTFVYTFYAGAQS